MAYNTAVRVAHAGCDNWRSRRRSPARTLDVDHRLEHGRRETGRISADRFECAIAGGSNRIESEVRRERLAHLSLEPDPAPLLRTLLRLRHDLVMIGRAVAVPPPDAFQARLGPALAHFRDTATDYLRRSSVALIRRRALDAVEGLSTITMPSWRRFVPRASSDAADHFFTLGFGLDQLRRNFHDLARCVSSAKIGDIASPAAYPEAAA